jgi:DNA-directed RNA polymerase specialized sigma24 family protein
MQLPESSPEASAEAACRRGDYESAATHVLQSYGSEVYTFLLARFADSSGADEAFYEFAEDFWCKLPRFDWGHPLRAFCYQLARIAAERVLGGPDTRREAAELEQLAVPDSRFVGALARQVQLRTKPRLVSEVSDEYQKLRERLGMQERDLLILHVDRGLSFRELAFAMLAPGDATDSDQLEQRAASWRERFATLRSELSSLAAEAGLL